MYYYVGEHIIVILAIVGNLVHRQLLVPMISGQELLQELCKQRITVTRNYTLTVTILLVTPYT